MNLKRNLRHYLDQSGWTVSQLARRCGGSVPRSSISEWLNGSKSIRNLDSIKKVADALGVTVDALLYGDPTTNENTDGILDSMSDGADGWLSGAFEVKLRPLKRGRRE